MVATLTSTKIQVTWVVRFCVVPSEYVPVAVNRCCVNRGMLGVAGVTAMT